MADILPFTNRALRKRRMDSVGILNEWFRWSIAVMSDGRIIDLLPCETAEEAHERAPRFAAAHDLPFVGQVQRVIRLEAAE